MEDDGKVIETFSINPLGDTQREQWENMVNVYCHCIRVSTSSAHALETLNSLQSEVIRFMEWAFDIIESIDDTEGDK